MQTPGRRPFGISLILCIGVVVVGAGGVAMAVLPELQKKDSPVSVTNQPDTSAATPSATGTNASSTPADAPTDMQRLGQELSHGACTGIGSKSLGSSPMRVADIGIIEPYGLMVGGHVTPVDHQYYYPTGFTAGLRDTAQVLAPADGVITEITHRGDKTNTPIGVKDVPSSDEYRIVISYSCDFFSYVDLVTSLDDSIKSQMPADWNSNGNSGANIPVKQGQVIGRVGGQSLDFAVWDLTKSLPGLLVPAAYDNAEPWKVHTVQPLDYFTDAVKKEVLPFYTRSVAPIDGKLDYDQDGKLVGTWFQEGTNGYLGSATPGLVSGYWSGHLSIAYNYIDPTAIEVSIGNYPGGAAQFAAKRSSPDPATVSKETGLVAYELGALKYVQANGTSWNFETPASGLTLKDVTAVTATVLFQLQDTRILKAEVFPGKTAAQVSGFDDKAVLYTRGDGATSPRSTTATP